MWIFRWFLSRTVRQAVDVSRHVKKLIRAQEDQLSDKSRSILIESREQLRNAIRTTGDKTQLLAEINALENVANRHLKPYPNARWRENIEVFLVTGAVVLALRTFFFQPMAIPSGSAQPTLWGIEHWDLGTQTESVVAPAGLSWFFHLFWYGDHYYQVKVRESGSIRRIEPPKTVFPFIKKQTIYLDNDRYTLWFVTDDIARRARIAVGQDFQAGQYLVNLKVRSGDHLFVNRMIYNFRHPRRGEIIVFTSTGIPGITQNTHYIKRLIGLGGETVQIGDDRHVIIDGVRLDASTPRFELVYGFDPSQPPQSDFYSGHVNNTVVKRYLPWASFAPNFPDAASKFHVRPDHYLAFGDNTMDSSDGRAWGDFPEDKVIGRASFVFWPISDRFGLGYR